MPGRACPLLRAVGFLLVSLLGTTAIGAESAATSATMSSGDGTLVGKRATRQLLLSGAAADGSESDLTRSATWASLQPEIAQVSATGLVTPVGNGEATIVARSGSLEASAKVTVSGMDQPSPVSFHLDVIPALSQAGCNMGACHGTPTGKGGFRLSLRGYLPDQDYDVLTREATGRRVNVLAPESSLILRKPLGEVPHEGGLRLRKESKGYEFLRAWVAEGTHNDPGAQRPVRLESIPGDRVLHAPANSQQVAVIAHYADGTTRDVTSICYYDSSSPDIAEVSADAHVTFKRRGEAAIIAHYLDLVAITRLTHLIDVPGFTPAPVPEDSLIDHAVFAKLNRMRIAPSPEASDREFVRRIYLDTLGTLPTPEEVDAFLGDTTSERYVHLVDGLLKRPEFLDFWTLKLADVLRANGRLIQAKGTQAFHRWIHDQLAADTPMDQFVRKLLTSEGSTFSNPPANYYRISRDPESAVETTAQLFLGVRIQCAKCHNHPFERWTQDDYYGLGAFFARVNRKKGSLGDDEVIFASGGGEVRQPRTGQVMKPKALGGPAFETQGDRREALADWLTRPDNPFFAKSLVNRIWFHLMGRGIVEPVDDFRDSNPPSNEELLSGLADDFVKGGYNLRGLIRSILLSRTYRLSAEPTPLNKDDNLYNSHAATKMLPAEVLLDAISTVTATKTGFNGLPDGLRAVQLPDGNMDDPFLKTFGRPARELACECERESDSNLSQALQLIGGATVNNKLRDDNGRMATLAKGPMAPEAITRELYLVALSREPAPGELEAAVKHLTATPDRRQAIEDLAWVLINSKEFLFRH